VRHYSLFSSTLSVSNSLPIKMEPGSLVYAFNEWDPLQECIVGVASHSLFPSESKVMMKAVCEWRTSFVTRRNSYSRPNTLVPQKHLPEFRIMHPFPKHLIESANRELDHLAKFLEAFGVRVFRPSVDNWGQKKVRYSAAMV
jgi:hypothetical protein